MLRFARKHQWHLSCDFDDPVPSGWNGDGVLAFLGPGKSLWRSLRSLTCPIVDLTESHPEIPLPRVTVDNGAIGRMAAEYFLEKGFQNFAFVQRWELGVSLRRREHFLAAIEARNHRCEVLSWSKERGEKPDTPEERHQWLKHRLRTLPTPIAILARDNEAIEVIEACLACNISIPDQVAVLGVDNNQMICEGQPVPLSSVDNNLEQIGYEGAALLDRLMRGEAAPPSPIYLSPSHIAERRSTESLAIDHPKVLAALQFIRENAHQPIGMPDVVNYVAMSRSGLEKAFREHYIRPPMEELRQFRFALAQKMLRETNKKIDTIAQQTGFQTSQNLCRSFQQRFGMTPRQFRIAEGYGQLDRSK